MSSQPGTPRRREAVVDGRDETTEQRADRNWDDLLQELRVMQTGTQVLFGFLLAVAFQPRFADLDAAQTGVYVALIVLAALATILALTPVSMHRTLFGQRRKPQLVRFGSAIVTVNLAVIGILSIGVTALIIDFVLGRWQAALAAVLGLALVLALWTFLPHWTRNH